MNILTFDIEEWYIYSQYPKGGKLYYLPILDSLLDKLLGILEEKQIKATFFCLGIIAREYPEVIKKIKREGHEIGCHSDKHLLIPEMTQSDFKKDLTLALDSIENVTGEKIEAFRAPAFSITDKTSWVFSTLVESGIKYDCSVFPTSRRGGGFPDFPESGPVIVNTAVGKLIELPINTCRLLNLQIAYSGGGYFRLYPYPIISRMISRSDYVITYFHLRDFDVSQKRLISLNYFKSYYGIDKMLPKFVRLLNDFQFETVSSFSEKLDINRLAVINF